MTEKVIFNKFILRNLNNSLFNDNSTLNSTSTEKSFITEKFHYIWITFLLIHIVYFFFMVIKLNCFKKDVLQEVDENAQRRRINEECPICMDNIRNEVQLICSHSFCASCLLNYGKHTFNMINILCPMCRQQSKLLFANFEREGENKDLYDQILNYNHDFTQNNSTSLCFCIDILRLFIFYIRQIANCDNPRYRGHRACLCLVLLLIFIYLIVLFTHQFKNAFDIVEDVFYYFCLIFVIAEYFYRNFRNRTNSEYELYASESVDDLQIESNRNNNEEREDRRV